MGDSPAALLKALKGAAEKDDAERMADILEALTKTEITMEVLEELKIGAVVASYRKHSDTSVATKAKTLVKKWKEMAAAAGVTKTKDNVGFVTTVSEFREKSRRKLLEVLKKIRDTPSCYKLAEEIEVAMTKTFQNHETVPEKKKEYVVKLRQLVFNLKKNTGLCEAVIDSDVTPAALVAMSVEELATPQLRAERQAMRDFQRDARSLDWDKRNRDRIMKEIGIDESKGMFQCAKCKSKRISNHAKQTRSADEPMTQFFECADCGNRWRF
uniref:Transcription elongation factor S-II n=1 Tax=Aureoumbra lagunensis TaxID=44058 RepID=A0A7S3NK08_9STRA|eukprot:CAMPEP_0197328876 /NCGR_PEP_ID=MMETSP0892-20130614/5153_1 /TAXON_ID=44058 ORGANISM="Aureoumbra lagunensis, Strain CCMP1510" /NCGR_SAMPLE_ID=MMETSP0892 /ASSEMBLY_ACC=CAM_ASM_000538 /LENGTH=269 /DNA_ID=CAMNT_0042825149 /DNA_START=23 /DNA_END=832 /DNA_ORIENTATION=-